MQADEQIGLVVVGDRGPLVERHVPVVVSREQHANAEPRLDGGLEAARDGQRQVFLITPLGALDAVVLAAMARIDRDRPNRRRLAGRATAAGREAAAATGGAGAWRGFGRPPPPGRSSAASSCRPAVLVARNPAKRGPRSTPSVVASIDAHRLDEALRLSCPGAQRRIVDVERVGVEPDHQPVVVLRHRAARRAAWRRSSAARRAPSGS